MTISKRIISIVCVALLTGWLVQFTIADDHVDVEYAEEMPLATESMLLDITRSGNTLVAVGERGHVVTSKDGENWVQAEHVPTRSTLTTVFSVGNRIWAGGHDAVIITSADKGNTWTRLFFDPDRGQAVMDIYFTDEHNGLAIGSYGLYLETTDAGKTWTESIVDEESDYHLNSISNFGNGKWLIAGEAGLSYRSFDNRQTWELMNMPYLGSMWGALKTNAECVLFYGLRGHVLESCDFGSTWNEVNTGSESSVSGAAEYDDLVVLAANSGVLLIRDDASGFRSYHHTSGVDFASVLSVGDGNFLLVGEDGIHRYPENLEEGDGDE